MYINTITETTSAAEPNSSMYRYTYTHMYVYVYTYTHIYTLKSIHAYTHKCIHIHRCKITETTSAADPH